MGKRQESRQRIEAQILDLARRQLITEGAAGLSVRAIARDLGMASSAVYRYVASRDQLLTLLLVATYSELADRVEQARERVDGGWRAEIMAIAHAMRTWALEQPASWALLYGSPVPGYHAPPELTVGPGTRVVGIVFGAVAKGLAAGAIVDADSVVKRPLSEDLQRIRAEFGFPGGDALVLRCTTLWAAVVGAISLEVFGQYGLDTFTDTCGLFDHQVGLVVDSLGAETN